jgi:Family of unknown function (DUF5677)
MTGLSAILGVVIVGILICGVLAWQLWETRKRLHSSRSTASESSMTNDFTIYGFPDECRNFEQRHPLWQEIMPDLEHALNLAFTRVQVMDGPADKLVYFFGRVCLEDFMEILLVCYHGYGVAASKLVRSMYEYTVTLRYLHEHPTEVKTFLDYHRVQNDKLISRLIETFGDTILPAETIADARHKAAEVKENFIIPVCDHPDAKMRLNHTWNKLDFAAMAKKTGALGTLIIPGYYFPLRHAHPTFGGLTERMEIVDERMGLKSEAQPEIADRSLTTAHNCILNALEVQKERFKIEGLEDAMQVCYRDFVRVWSPDSPLLKASCLR